MSEIIPFPRKIGITNLGGFITAVEVMRPSRSETLIRTLEAIITNMVDARGLDWTMRIANDVLARKIEEVEGEQC